MSYTKYNFADLVSFSRGSTATYYGSDGLLHTAAVDEPRIAYDPATGTRLGLLIEESRTNVLTYSEDLTNAVYYLNQVTIASNSVIAPNGTLTADRISESSSTSSHSVYHDNVSNSASADNTFTVFIKDSGSGYAGVSIHSTSSTYIYGVMVDLILGTITDTFTYGSGAVLTAYSIEDVGNGWYRVSVTGNNPSTFNYALVFTSNSGAWSDGGVANYHVNAYAGSAANGIYTWGWQLELTAAFPTSYIPTTSAAVTRAADIPVHTFGTELAQNKGTVVIRGKTAGGKSATDLANTAGYWLADTDATSLVGGNLADSSATYVIPGRYSNISSAPSIGHVYKISLDISGAGTGTYRLIFGGFDTAYPPANVGTKTFYVTATTVDALYIIGDGNTSGSITNIYITPIDADRSVNTNGLIVNGTVTRAPVATGAELVGYSGFSASNYLEQPYNADLDFGTGDFCVMGWVNPSVVANSVLFARGDAALAGGYLDVMIGSGGNFGSWDGTTGRDVSILSTTTYSTGVWYFVCVKRSSGTRTIYVNGIPEASQSDTRNISNTSAIVRSGCGVDGTGAFSGHLALWRISATAPSADKIRNIYLSEVDYFQPNSQFTIPTITKIPTTQTICRLNDGTIGNMIRIERDPFGKMQFYATANSAQQHYSEIGASTDAADFKVAVAYDGTGYSGVLNGGTVYANNAVASIPNFTTLDIGSGLTDLQLSSTIQDIQYYPVRLTDAQIKALTT